MRADATANRTRILECARAALDAGKSPAMSAVARAAGVGQATLYRHFPTWSDLVLAVHREEMEALIASAPGLLQKLSADEALRSWLLQLGEYGRLKQGLDDAMHRVLLEETATDDGSVDLSALDLLLEAGRLDGTLRGDVSAPDLLQLVGFLWRLDDTEDRPQRCGRLVDVVVGGLRAPR